MARASIPTLLSLDQYAQIVGLEPHHFNGVHSAAFPVVADLQTMWYQYPYMRSGRISREELAQAIATAEELIAALLGFWPAPRWIVAETHEWPQPSALLDADLLSLSHHSALALAALRRSPTINLTWGHLRAPGRRVVTPIATDVTVTYLDGDHDGYQETAQVSYPLVDASAWRGEEVWVLPAGEEALPQNILRPLQVTCAATGVVATGGSELFVRPALWLASPGRPGLDGDDPETFVETVDLYRVTTETSGEENAPLVLLYQDTAATPPAWLASYALLQPRDAQRSAAYVLPVAWDVETGAWTHTTLPRRPDRAVAYYRAGYPLAADGRMAPLAARAVAALATSLMSKMTDPVGPEWNLVQVWQSEPENPAYSQMVCPWGRMNGAWEAYQIATRSLSDLEGLAP